MSETRPHLRALAERAGISPGYFDALGVEHVTSDDTRERLLAAMDLPAASEDEAGRTLAELGDSPRVQPDTDAIACVSPGDVRRAGLLASLYAVRRNDDLGAGDFGTLRALVDWAAELGLDFVGINPLHALDLAGRDPSPYSPTSRLHLHALYIDLEAVPELEHSHEAQMLLADEAFRVEVARLRARMRVDAPALLALRMRVLRALHACFEHDHAAAATGRGSAYRAFLAREGETLFAFAVFQALVEHLGSDDWRRWPAAFRDRRSPEVRAFADAHPHAVALHGYVQFELDRQLGEVAKHARARGLAFGLHGDLAVGCVPGGADTWARPDLFARGVGLGAPPDAYAREGQTWGLAPLLPTRLLDGGDGHFTSLLEHAMRHVGILRIDHVMGLCRQFWVPEGMPASAGTYVRFPQQALFDAVARASQRHGCVVVGEDLGTVPEGFREAMTTRGMLRSQVLYFERAQDGSFLPPTTYAQAALVTANTHDLPTLPGFWSGDDLVERRARGGLDEAALHDARAERAWTLERLVQRLRDEALLDPGPSSDDAREITRAAYAMLARTPSALLGIALDDLAEEALPVNLAGTPDPRHDNWRRRIRRSLAELRADRALGDWIRALRPGSAKSPDLDR